MTLKQIAEAIAANVKALDSGAKTIEQFRADNRKLWDAASNGEACIIGTAASRRMSKLHQYLAQIR